MKLKKMEAENKKENDDNGEEVYASRYSNSSEHSDKLKNYAVLLMPFYDQNINVPKFFDKLLQSKDDDVRMNAAVVLLRNNKQVADSLFTNIAAKDNLRGKLFSALEEIKRLDKFPAKYKTQVDMARSYLVMDKGFDKIDSIVRMGNQKAAYYEKKGLVYFFKYRVKKDDDWKIGSGERKGISGDAICRHGEGRRFIAVRERRRHDDGDAIRTGVGVQIVQGVIQIRPAPCDIAARAIAPVELHSPLPIAAGEVVRRGVAELQHFRGLKAFNFLDEEPEAVPGFFLQARSVGGQRREQTLVGEVANGIRIQRMPEPHARALAEQQAGTPPHIGGLLVFGGVRHDGVGVAVGAGAAALGNPDGQVGEVEFVQDGAVVVVVGRQHPP